MDYKIRFQLQEDMHDRYQEQSRLASSQQDIVNGVVRLQLQEDAALNLIESNQILSSQRERNSPLREMDWFLFVS